MLKRFIISLIVTIVIANLSSGIGILAGMLAIWWILFGGKKEKKTLSNYENEPLGHSGKKKHHLFKSCGAPFNKEYLERPIGGCRTVFYDRETLNMKEYCPICNYKLYWGFNCAECNAINYMKEDHRECIKCGYYTDRKYL